MKKNKFIQDSENTKSNRLFTLSFTLWSVYSKDTIYIAMNYPYTNRNSHDFFRLLKQMPTLNRM